jgi:hypothetical protein
MFRTVFPSIIRSSRLHIQQQVYVKQLLLLCAVAVFSVLSSWWWRKDRPKHVQCFTRINNLRNRCILLVLLYQIYYDARTYERQKTRMLSALLKLTGHWILYYQPPVLNKQGTKAYRRHGENSRVLFRLQYTMEVSGNTGSNILPQRKSIT